MVLTIYTHRGPERKMGEREKRHLHSMGELYQGVLKKYIEELHRSPMYNHINFVFTV